MSDVQMLPADKAKLQHMLGATPNGYSKSKWGFRNHYAASKGGEQEAAMRRLESVGLVEQGREGESLIFFHATVAGCKAVGLRPKQIERAMEE
jgi:hypothetical protein